MRYRASSVRGRLTAPHFLRRPARRQIPALPLVLGRLGVLAALALALGLLVGASLSHAGRPELPPQPALPRTPLDQARSRLEEARKRAKLAAQPKQGRVLVLRIDGPISPVTAEALAGAVDRAERESYRALVIQIDTPGGLESSMRDMVKRLLASSVPILTYVSPSGARAASAGVFIVMAGDVAAMAPGTNMGAATPVNLQGAMDSTLARKATSDAAAFARTVARQRGRNAEWAEDAVRKAVAASETEAVDLGVVDFVANSLDDLLEQADGITISRPGLELTLALSGLPRDTIKPTLRQKLLGVLVDPNVAYILMLLGFYGLLFELQNPGAILPGVVGGICLILAFLALSTLPVNYAGVALIVLAIAFFLAEVKVASHGLLATGGVVALVLGSVILFQGQGTQLSWSIILGATGATAVFFLFIVGKGLRAQGLKVTTGRKGLLGTRATAVGRLAPAGQVRIGGELWNAVSESDVEAGSEVVVTGVEGLTLRVRRAKEA
jgi:membrane-bound serine protease (ClpP class)